MRSGIYGLIVSTHWSLGCEQAVPSLADPVGLQCPSASYLWPERTPSPDDAAPPILLGGFSVAKANRVMSASFMHNNIQVAHQCFARLFQTRVALSLLRDSLLEFVPHLLKAFGMRR